MQDTGLQFKLSENSGYIISKAPVRVSKKTTNIAVVTIKGELQKRNLQDSQTSATVHKGIELDQSTDRDLYDLIDRTPGVTTVVGNTFSIRGIRGYDRISVTVDGMQAPDSFSARFGAFSVWDLEQVEILRGPQSTQSGANALAGAINIRTANPTFNQETKLRADVGTANTTKLAIAHNRQLSMTCWQ